ncbi:Inorganic phosphate transporter pho84 [Lobosporangium transversale]|uniref:Major facilitator superfamily domain-containing protein n=1 Tax=Lobosporangium transversale TaxID=64571 RepID=A0A1Y2GZX6_9FUNG|nr:major facilitator superfamily domain-containing protein [Lobosporangium transversale]KAF9898443.1 Inorganic phosphate transporter pho84 [Lobosporangium transversale]ORZ27825.1 major facilitator superfamily domain-containing protein [Lobosporangium transversale]|eukprot:XP_021885528.1 major facilitator superfamily domain-containing protein [Lobosporangium transversale]
MNELSSTPSPYHSSLRPPPRRGTSGATDHHHPHDDPRSQSYTPSYPQHSYSPTTSPAPHHAPTGFGQDSVEVEAGQTSTTFSRGSVYDDPRKRRLDTLALVDNAEFGWFHVRACMVAGVGFFTDAYDLFAINLVSPMLGYVYFSHLGNSVPADIDLGLKISASIGTFFGQIGFGYLADVLGRKRMYGVELLIIIVATFGQAVSGDSYALSLPASIILWRFILGVGVGGDYPLSAVITSEFATTHRRGAMMAAVFAMQGFGYLTTGIVAIVLLLGFRSLIELDPKNLDYVWRSLIGLGCVPALVAVYFRMTIPETPRFVLDVENNLIKAENDVATVLKTRNALQSDRDVVEERHAQFNIVYPRKGSGGGRNEYANAIELGHMNDDPSPRLTGAQSYTSQTALRRNNGSKFQSHQSSLRDFCRYFSRWETFKVLMGTSMTWFALDVAFYGIGLNNTFILSTIHFGAVDGNAYYTMWNATVGQVIIVLLGAIPGYWVTVFTIERLGRIKIQVIGFVMSCALFCTLGFAYNVIHDTSPVLFVFLFAVTQFFQNFGPNATTFIIPGECFPTRYRSTGHGISAGMGKLGAIVAQIGFSNMKDRGGKNQFIPQLLQIFALFMFIGLLFTYFVPETKGKTLEELCGEDDYAERQLERERPFNNNHLYEEKEDD